MRRGRGIFYCLASHANLIIQYITQSIFRSRGLSRLRIVYTYIHICVISCVTAEQVLNLLRPYTIDVYNLQSLKYTSTLYFYLLLITVGLNRWIFLGNMIFLLFWNAVYMVSSIPSLINLVPFNYDLNLDD